MSLVKEINGTFYLPYLSVKPNYCTLYYRNEKTIGIKQERDKKDKQPKPLRLLRNCSTFSKKRIAANKPAPWSNFQLYCMPLEMFNKFFVAETGKAATEDNNAYGLISEKAAKRISAAVNWMYDIAVWKKIYIADLDKTIKFKLSFLTLTLPAAQMHSDTEIKEKALNHFLTILRTKYSVGLYIWKAEKQKNGNIHIHLVLDVFVHFADYRREWNKVLAKLGYIEAYSNNQKAKYLNGFFYDKNLTCKNREGEIVPVTFEVQQKRYIQGVNENWSNPNSTDIHSVKNVKDLRAYIAEYLTKNPFNDEADLDKCKELIESIKKVKAQVKGAKKQASDMLLNANDRLKSAIEHSEKVYNEITEELETLSAEFEYYKKHLIEGRIWFQSSQLSKCKLTVDLLKDGNEDDFIALLNSLPEDKIRFLDMDGKPLSIENDNLNKPVYYTMALVNASNLMRAGAKKLGKIYDRFIRERRKLNNKIQIENRLKVYEKPK